MTLETLTWDDICDWAGLSVAGRGKSYITSVDNLCRLPEGPLLATVQGRNKYQTTVGFTASGNLSASCTCPYGGICKHAVAVILCYQKLLNANINIPVIEEDDPRQFELAHDTLEADRAFLEDQLDEEDDDSPFGFSLPDWLPNRRKPGKDPVREYILSLSPKRQTDLLLYLAQHNPNAEAYIRQQIPETGTDRTALIRKTLRAIKTAAKDPGWSRHWSEESFTPDYTPVKKCLEQMARLGMFEDLLKMGEALLTESTPQLEASDDSGETGSEVASCMEVIANSVATSRLSDLEKIEWGFNLWDMDSFGFFHDSEDVVKKLDISRTRWSALASELTTAIKQAPKVEHDAHVKRRVRTAVFALDKSARQDEIPALLEFTVEQTGDYDQLVESLLAGKRYAEAEKWIRIGLEVGSCHHLPRFLLTLAEKRKDRPLTAALQAEVFFYNPSMKTFRNVEKTLKDTALWPPVRLAMLHWLETGIRPDGVPTTSSGADPQPPEWPLPQTGLPRTNLTLVANTPPHNGFALLIDLALREARYEDAITLLNAKLSPDSGTLYLFENQARQVAKALQREHPEKALTVWENLLTSYLAHVTPSLYDHVCSILKTMRPLYKDLNRPEEWDQRVQSIRAAYSGKRKLLERIDGLK